MRRPLRVSRAGSGLLLGYRPAAGVRSYTAPVAFGPVDDDLAAVGPTRWTKEDAEVPAP